jgi:OmpA family protein
MMRKLIRIVIGAMALSLIAAAAMAQKPIIYPAKGQSPEQQNRDEGECYVWARQTTGIDPAALAAAPPPQQQASGGTVVAGAAKGAVAGTAIGAIAGNTGKGAAIGAVTGVMVGRRQAQHQAAAANQQAQAGQQQALATYYRAQSACLEGRGYTVN